ELSNARWQVNGLGSVFSSITKYGPLRVSWEFRKSGRLKSRPSLDSLPQRYRSCFIARNDRRRLVWCALPQLEMQMAARLSSDPNPSANFRLGWDPHMRTACRVYKVARATDEQYQFGRKLNLAVVAGAGTREIRELSWKARGVLLTDTEADDLRN